MERLLPESLLEYKIFLVDFLFPSGLELPRSFYPKFFLLWGIRNFPVFKGFSPIARFSLFADFFDVVDSHVCREGSNISVSFIAGSHSVSF